MSLDSSETNMKNKLNKKIFLLSDGIPPRIAGSAVIVGNIAQQFSSEEMVIAGAEPYAGPPLTWSDNWPKLHYIAAPWPVTRRGLRWWRWIEFPRTLIRAYRLARQNHCSVVVAVFPKQDFLLIGYLVAQWTGSAFYPYLHNTYLDQRTGLGRIFASWFQPKMFKVARHIFVMSEGMVELFKSRYPETIDRCSALVHSYSGEIPTEVDVPEPKKNTEFLVSGNIHEICLDAIQRCAKAIFELPDCNITFLGGTPKSQLHKLGLLREGVKTETIKSEELVTRIRQADILILPHGLTGKYADVEYQTVFPTRTVEYLVAGRPILAHSPPDCYLTRFLRKHDCALVVDKPDIQALQSAIHRLKTDAKLRERLVKNALKTAQIFQAPRVAAHLRAVLKKDNLL